MPCKRPIYRENAGCVVACGQCTPCILKKQREKAARVLLEDRSAATRPLFVTLSYDNAHLPIRYLVEDVNPKTGEVTVSDYSCITGTLRPDHIVNFNKRLRYYAAKLGHKSVRMVYAGEYGDDKKRPHYHLIVWGVPYKDRQIFWDSWVDANKQPMCDKRRLTVEIPRNDRHVANYLSKYLLSPKKKKKHPSLNGAYPEFYRTSKGLGLKYADGVARALTKQSGLANLWVDGKLPSSFTFDGKSYPIDRYMKEKIYEKLPPLFREELPKAALENYKAELSQMLKDARDDPSICSTIKEMTDEVATEYLLTAKNAVRAQEVEQRHSFFTSKRKNQDV